MPQLSRICTLAPLLLATTALAQFAPVQLVPAQPAAPASPQAATQPATPSTPDQQRSKETLLAEIAAYNLPSLTYSGESIVRFTSAAQKLPADKRRRLADAITELKKIDENAPELATLLPMRWRTLATLTGPDTEEGYSVYREISPDINSTSAIRQRAGNLEQVHASIQSAEDMLRKGQPMDFDYSPYALSNIMSRYPGDPAVAFLVRRRLEAASPGEPRDALEQTLLNTYADTPAAKQHAVQKYLEENAAPLPLPSEISKAIAAGKPTLIHFWSPTPAGAAYLSTLKSLSDKFNDQLTILCIPLGTPEAAKTYTDKESLSFPQIQAPDFAKSQGITDAEVPVTYLLTPDGKLSSIRYDNRLEKPLQRLLSPN